MAEDKIVVSLKAPPPDILAQRYTRVCLVCERLENPGGSIVIPERAWLCPKCKTVLFNLVKKEDPTDATD